MRLLADKPVASTLEFFFCRGSCATARRKDGDKLDDGGVPNTRLEALAVPALGLLLRQPF